MARRFVSQKPTPFKPFENDPGAAYIYVLTNREFRYIKVGFTTRSPKERAKELAAATGVPGEFRVARDWFVPADLAQRIERQAHTELKRLGVHHKKEFFDAKPAKAAEVIEAILAKEELLDLANAKEDARQQRLHQYYAAKTRKLREDDEGRLRAAKRLADEARLAALPGRLWLAVDGRHKIRLTWVPHSLAAFLALAMCTIALEMQFPWIWALVILVGTWFFAFETIREIVQKRIREHYRSKVEWAMVRAKAALQGTDSREFFREDDANDAFLDDINQR